MRGVGLGAAFGGAREPREQAQGQHTKPGPPVTGGDVSALSRADELREVLLNLLENARHAHATRVVARVERQLEKVAIVVEDDGDGIGADVLSRVFEPHFSTRTSGSGLGLAISKRLVDSWGGAIHLAPRRPRGTIVHVTLVPASAP